MNTSGGYDFEVVGEVAKECECPICLLLIKDAVELPCTHGYCTTCIQKWEQENLEKNSGLLCPSCKKAYEQDKVQRNKMIDRLIRTSLKVKCKENKEACDWIGTISDYKDHEIKCLFKSVQCNFHGCDMRVKRGDLNEHQRICKFRVVQCSYCEVEEKFNKLEIHYQMCRSYPLNCVNKECDVTLPRNEIEDHIKKYCNFQMIHCEYNTVGCHSIIQRKDLQKHLETSMQQHLKSLLLCNIITTANLNIRLANVEEMLSKTTEELQETKDQLQETKETLEATTIDLDQAKTRIMEFGQQLTISQNDMKNDIKHETNIIKKQLQENMVLNNQKFETIQEKTKSIENDCLQATKIFSLRIITHYTTKSVKEFIQLWKDKQSKDVDIDLSLHKELGLEFKNTEKSAHQQHIELLEKVTSQDLYRIRCEKLHHIMETYKLYHVSNNEIYVKVNVKEYVNKQLGIVIRDISYRSKYKSHAETKYYNDDICLHGDIKISFFLPEWANINTNVYIIHPQHDEEIQKVNRNGFLFKFLHYSFDGILLQEYLFDNELIIKLTKM